MGTVYTINEIEGVGFDSVLPLRLEVWVSTVCITVQVEGVGFDSVYYCCGWRCGF